MCFLGGGGSFYLRICRGGGSIVPLGHRMFDECLMGCLHVTTTIPLHAMQSGGYSIKM